MERRALGEALRGRWPRLALSFAFMVAATASYAVSVRVGGVVVDDLLRGSDARSAALLALGTAMAGALSWSLSDVFIAQAATAMAVKLRSAMVAHVLALPIGFFTERSVGEITDRISTDVDTIASGIVNQLKPIAMGVLGAAAALVMSVTVDGRLTLLFIPTAVGIGWTGRRAGVEVASRSRLLQAEWAEAAGTAEEAFGAREDLRQVLGRGLIMRRWAEHAARLVQHKNRLAQARNRLTLSTAGMLRLFQVLILAGGARLASTGELGAGDVWAAFGLVTLFSRRVEEVLASLPRVSELLAATQRVTELLAEPPEPSITVAEQASDAEAVTWSEPVGITVDGVRFAYAEGPLVLDGVTFSVRPGRTLALVGRTGSGKSTIAKLVNRSVTTPPGHVFIGGVDVCAIPVSELRRQVGVVSQRVELLGASLRDNITLFDTTISDDSILAALAHLGLDGWLDDLPAGLDARLGEGATVLSAGEEQLVAFARLLVRNPSIVVLDEATARLDPATETLLRAATERLLAGRTSIVIAHRLDTISGADDVVVLEEGRVIEHGGRRALMDQADSVFRGLVDAAGGVHVHDDVEAISHRGAEHVGVREDTSEGASGSRNRAIQPRVGQTTRRLLARHPANIGPGVAGWAVFFIAPAVTAWVWSVLVGELDPGGDATGALTVFAIASAVGLGGKLVGEWFFSRWWLLSNITTRSNLLAAQLHPHDQRAGARPRSSGDAISRMWDTDALIQFADHWVDLACTAGFVVLATALSGRWSMLPWLLAPIALPATGAWLFRRRIERVAVDHAAIRGLWSGRVAEVCGAAATIKGFAAELHVERHLADLTEERQRLALRLRMQELSVFGSVFFVAEAGQRLVLLGTATAVASGSVTADEVPARVGASVAAAEAIALMPIAGIVTCMILVELPAVRAKLSRLMRLLPDRPDFDLTRPPDDLRLPPDDPLPVPTERPSRVPVTSMKVCGARVVHPDGTLAIDDVSLEIERGQLVIVTGPIASGKTTLLRVLAGLCPLSGGSLWWNDERIDDASGFLRPPNCSFVSQAPKLISGTVEENVTLDHDLDMWSALRLAELDRDVERAGGSSTFVGHRGLRLSGGQTQRMATARATAAGSELLVLDDLSSALDVVTERQLWQNLRAAGQTVVATSYKRSALELADQIVVLRRGRIDAVGPLHSLEPDFGHLFA